MRAAHITIRKAERHDADRVKSMQELSFCSLGARYYSPAAIASFIRHIGTCDQAVIEEGHYFVAVVPGGEIVGTGGWSQLAPAYGHDEAPPAGGHLAIIRSVFVAPSATRLGIGSAVMRHAEADAARHGVTMLSLKATLAGVPLYAALGYRAARRREFVLADGARLDFLDMDKPIAGQADAA